MGITGASCEVPYSMAKAAIIGFTRALAKEVGPSHITVNCVAPGVIDTDMNQNLTRRISRIYVTRHRSDESGHLRRLRGLFSFLHPKMHLFLQGRLSVPTADL